MNLQGITIIFIIIFLPIFLISTFYIQNEIDTINMQTSYDAKLIDATTDALSAFEINTANENLSQMADSLRSMIEASNNIFTTTLASNLGMSGASQNKILPYIPAIVYTLYDGYYIYSPNQSPMVLTSQSGRYVKVGDVGVEYAGTGDNYYYYPNDKEGDPGAHKITTGYDGYENIGKMLYCLNQNCDPNKENKIECTTDPEKAYFTTKYMLKSFTPYTMSYKKENDFDITINYTLDNYITISGTKIINENEIYYTKSGYLIDPDVINFDDPSLEALLDTDDKIDAYLSAGNNVKITISNEIDISSNDLSAESKDYTTGSMVSDNISALKYYLKAYAFSKWVQKNFGDLSEADIRTSNTELQDGFSIKQNGLSLFSSDESKLFYTYGTNSVFKTNGAWNVENSESNFYEHKRNVIKNSIQYNLNMAMAVYNAGKGDEYYQMPILSDPEWDKLLSNVSILSFMQGLPCGLKTYNNFAIVTSTNNEIMTNMDDIYYIPINNKSADGVKTSDDGDKAVALDTAHHIDCVDDDWINQASGASYFQSYSSKDSKYDKEYVAASKSYKYDHVANNCYYCIINRNYDETLRNAILRYKHGLSLDDDPYKDYKDLVPKLVKAEMIATAKIKNNTYKSIASLKNYGVSTQDLGNTNVKDGMSKNLNITSDLDYIKVVVDVQKDPRAKKMVPLLFDDSYESNGKLGNGKQTFIIKYVPPSGINTQTINVYIEPKEKKETIQESYIDADGNTRYRDREIDIFEYVKIISATYYYK